MHTNHGEASSPTQLKRAGMLLCLLALLISPSVWAQSITLNENEERIVEDFNWLPYAFFSEAFGLGVGVGVGYTGWPQEPCSLLGAITVGTEGSYNITGILTDYQLPQIPRLRIEPLFSVGRYQNQRLYLGRNPEYGGERSGSNDSDPDHFIEATQWDRRVEVAFRYLLPIGHGRDQIVNRYIIKRGLLTSGESGGDAWNPASSGRTTFSVTPGWREQTLGQEDLEVPFETLNAEAEIKYDNHEFPANPTRGSAQRIAYKRDFSDDANFGGWEAWTVEADKVFNMGSNDHFDQRVLALGVWSAYVPTWETDIQDGVEVTQHRTPHYEGATLGGLYRMRAYEEDRFQDKAAIHYSAEFRIIPTWQPLRNAKRLQWADISWWQWVFFAEAGRVAPDYTTQTLYEDLHYDGGVGLRAMIYKAVCRLDVAFGEEGTRIVAMYGHPF